MTWANRLTLGRLGLAGLLFGLFTLQRVTTGLDWVAWLLPLLVAAGTASDLLDGRIARARGELTGFGRLFDPFADSIFRFTTFLCLWWAGLADSWMLAVLFLHDAEVSFLRVLAISRGGRMRHWSSYVVKEIAQELGMLLGLLLYAAGRQWPGLPLGGTAWTIMLLAALVTLASAVEAVSANRAALRTEKK